ncbi:MAG: hypothetical protein HQ513_17475 [Rhodospirillales bacterium]|nr:hypothetical protein [Rhodospirillales bacterium]
MRYETPGHGWTPEDHHLIVSVGNASLFPLTINNIFLANWFGGNRKNVNFFPMKPLNKSANEFVWSICLGQGEEFVFNLARSSLSRDGGSIGTKVFWLNSSLVIETVTGDRFRKSGTAMGVTGLGF